MAYDPWGARRDIKGAPAIISTDANNKLQGVALVDVALVDKIYGVRHD